MASFKQYTASGGATEAFSIPTFTKDELLVRVDGVLKTAGTGTTAGSSHDYEIQSYTVNGGTVAWVSGKVPGSGTVRIYRNTKILNNASTDVEGQATYYAGSSVQALDLNDNQKQVLRAAEEDDHLIQTWNIEDQAVTREKIKDDAVNGSKIADDSIDSEHYVADSIDTEHYAPLSVDNAALGNDSVNGNKIADDSINSEHYVDASIDLQHLADNSVNSAKIVNDSIVDADINSSAAITLTKLANGALPSGITVNSTNIVDGSIVNADVNASAAIEFTKLENLDSAKILVGNGSNKATEVAVSGDVSLANTGAVTIANDAVEQAMIADNAVGADQIAADAVGASEIAANAVGASELADNAVDTNAIQNDAVSKGKISEARLKTLADMHSGTASILSANTELLPSITELNQLDGKTLGETTLTTNSDTAIPTSKAVNDQILAVTNALGGFVAIDNETVFPNANPDPSNGAGTVVSISDAGGLSINASGVATVSNGNVANDATITINGFPNALRGGVGGNSNPNVLASGLGLQVHTTTTLHTYDYHKLIPDESGATDAQSAVTDFNGRYRVQSNAPNSSLDNGDLWFNTTSGSEKMMVYNASNSAWEQVTSIGSFYINTISQYTGTGGNSATFNGSAYRFTLSNPPTGGAQQLLVSINGVVQKPNSGTGQPSEGFAINGNDIVFASAPATGASYFIVTLGAAVDVGAPSDNTVSTAKIQNRAVTSDKIENNVQLDGTGSIQIPFGTTAQRSGSAANGMIRYNTTTSGYEGYSGSAWGALGGGATGGTNNPFVYENDKTVSQSYTLTADNNGMSAGPLTINNGVSIQVPSGLSWHII